jgi:hypothetical protein
MPETMTRSTTAKIRFPVEVLATVDEWAAAHQLPRSRAVRVLLMRGLWVTGGPSTCDCIGGPDTCTGNCR